MNEAFQLVIAGTFALIGISFVSWYLIKWEEKKEEKEE